MTTNAEKPRLDQMTGYAFDDRKITGTPTVFLNGEPLVFPAQLLDPAALRRAVLAAAPTSQTP